jgi:hypothetical protein
VSEYDYSSWAGWWNWSPPKLYSPPTCECGVSKTLGKDDHWQFHSDYCPIRKNKESNHENDKQEDRGSTNS